MEGCAWKGWGIFVFVVATVVNIATNDSIILVKIHFFLSVFRWVCLTFCPVIGKKTGILATALRRYQPVATSAAIALSLYQPITVLVCLGLLVYCAAGTVFPTTFECRGKKKKNTPKNLSLIHI